MVDVWDTASHLFSVADRDRSGDVDALEFRDALESFIEKVSPPPPSRTKWTRRVPHPVLIGHARVQPLPWAASECTIDFPWSSALALM